ncbi:MAG: polyprenol phosphomannose-dependent alpha 1,6 mannosyltransferase MptB [Acidimicrobiales bacterium]
MQTIDGRARRRPSLALLGVVGALGATGVVLASATVGSIPRPHSYRWWLRLPGLSYDAGHVLFYAALALLTLAWIGVGVHARAGRLSVRAAGALLVAWGTPLLVGAPVFSRDVYSYVADGVLARRGFNPYLASPHLLAGGPLYASIAEVWRHSPSPYGPLFQLAARLTAVLAGHSLMVQVVAFRALELLGVAALVAVLPRLARHYHVDPGLALWLGVLSPLALFSAISSAHNDTLMLGLMGVGLLLMSRDHRVGAAALFALAATVKLPAIAGLVVLYAGPWWRTGAGARVRLAFEAVVVTGAVLAGATGLAGDGWRWLSPHALAIPTELHVLITPVVSVGVLVASLLHAAGDHQATRAVVTATQHVGEALAVLGIVVVVVRTRAQNTVRTLGVSLLILVWLSPTVWPWYFLWGLTALAVTRAQRSAFLAATAGAAMLLVGPGGTPMIGGNGYLVAGPLLVGAAGWFVGSGRWRGVLAGADRGD